MKVTQRILYLLALLLSACTTDQPVLEPLPDNRPVDVYLLPSDRFPEKLTAHLAKRLSRETGLRIRGAMKLPPLELVPDPENSQYTAEDIVEAVQPIAKTLPDRAPDVCFIVLTMNDINDEHRQSRFYYSYSDRGAHTSMVSGARLLAAADGGQAPQQVAVDRFYKITKRTVGEIKLGWVSSSDRRDIMFAPITSLEDLDAMGATHAAQ